MKTLLKSLKVVTSVLLLIIIGSYIALALYAAFGTDSVIFQPHAPSYRDSAEVVKLKSSDGSSISVFYLRNPSARFTIVYSHGNAEDIGDLKPLLQEFHRQGFSILAYDYQGYGTSQGRSTENHSYDDELAAYRYLTEQVGIPSSSILLLGHSVGSGPAVDLASKKPVGGLIVISGFVSAFRVLSHWTILPFDKFNNIRKLRRIHCPVLVMHGRDDEVIPFWHGQALYQAANQPKQSLWIEQAGHNDIDMSSKYFPGLLKFAEFVAAHQDERNK